MNILFRHSNGVARAISMSDSFDGRLTRRIEIDAYDSIFELRLQTVSCKDMDVEDGRLAKGRAISEGGIEHMSRFNKTPKSGVLLFRLIYNLSAKFESKFRP